MNVLSKGHAREISVALKSIIAASYIVSRKMTKALINYSLNLLPMISSYPTFFYIIYPTSFSKGSVKNNEGMHFTQQAKGCFKGYLSCRCTAGSQNQWEYENKCIIIACGN